MLDSFGLSPLFYQFDIGLKITILYIFPLSLLLFYAMKKIQFPALLSSIVCVLMVGLDVLILYAYGMHFGVFFSSFFTLFALLMLWDIRYLYVPVILNFLAVLFGLYALLLNRPENLIYGFAFCGFLAFLQVAFRTFQKESLGDGDIFFALPFGMIFGLEGSLSSLFFGAFLGVLIFLILRVKRLPFIALLFFGSLLSFVVGALNV